MRRRFFAVFQLGQCLPICKYKYKFLWCKYSLTVLGNLSLPVTECFHSVYMLYVKCYILSDDDFEMKSKIHRFNCFSCFIHILNCKIIYFSEFVSFFATLNGHCCHMATNTFQVWKKRNSRTLHINNHRYDKSHILTQLYIMYLSDKSNAGRAKRLLRCVVRDVRDSGTLFAGHILKWCF